MRHVSLSASPLRRSADRRTLRVHHSSLRMRAMTEDARRWEYWERYRRFRDGVPQSGIGASYEVSGVARS